MVTLAAAFLIPEDVPEREVLILAAMVVTAGTLLLQGLTLPALVRALKLRGPDARSDALQAATVLQTAPTPASTPSIAWSSRRMRRRRWNCSPIGSGPGRRRCGRCWAAPTAETPSELYRRLRLQTLQVERDEVLKIRSSGTIDHDVVEQVLATLDIEESMLTIATRRADQLTEEQPVQTPPSPAGSCIHLEQAPAEIEPAGAEDLPGLRTGGNAYGAPADLPVLRQRRLLQLLGRPARRAARPRQPPPGDPQLRAGRVMALVLRRRAARLTPPSAIERRIRTGRPALFSEYT